MSERTEGTGADRADSDEPSPDRDASSGNGPAEPSQDDPSTDGESGGIWRIAQSLLVVLGSFMAAIAVTQWGTGAVVAIGLVAPNTPLFTVAQTILQFLGFLIGVVGFLAIAEEWDIIATEKLDREAALLTVGATLVLLVLQFALIYLFHLLGVSTGENRAMLPGQEDPTYFLYMIVVSLLIVGPIEELLFRGVVQGLLRKAFDAWPAILLASLIFGLIHFPAVQGTTEEALLYSGVAALLGVLLGYVYERTGNILVPAIAHGVYNATLFAIQFVYFVVLA